MCVTTGGVPCLQLLSQRNARHARQCHTVCIQYVWITYDLWTYSAVDRVVPLSLVAYYSYSASNTNVFLIKQKKCHGFSRSRVVSIFQEQIQLNVFVFSLASMRVMYMTDVSIHVVYAIM